MAKLRLKLMTQRKSKERKLLHQGKKCTADSRSRHLQQPAEHPPLPYLGCGYAKPLKVPKSADVEHHKLPHSPVNNKAADISFPCTGASPLPPPLPPRGTTSVPVTPLPKKWLTLGCDPCKQQRSLLHEDYKLQTRAVQVGVHHRQVKRGGGQERLSPQADEVRVASPKDWQQEMCWKVVARSENEFVRKRVVLQRKKSPSCSSTVFRPSSESCKSTTLQVDERLDAPVAEGRRNSFESRVGSFKSGSEAPVYKLTTTSPDQSMENDSFYAWDKDLSPFASESSIFTSFDSPSNMLKSLRRGSKVSPESRKSVSTTRYDATRTPSPGKTNSGERLSWSPSPPLLPAHFDDEYQGVHNDPEAVSKSWEPFRPCPSPLNIDEEAVAAHLHHHHHHRHQHKAPSTSSPAASSSSEYLCIQERESKRKEKDKRKQKRRAFTSRVKESFAVEKSSVNPYKDFRESMIEMILKKDLLDHGELEELLRSYLMLNSEEFHDLIVRVFTDLWYQLFCYDSS